MPAVESTIPARYQGPPDAANGGVVAGLLATPIGPAARIRLEAAVPLGTSLRVQVEDGGSVLWAGEQRLAAGRRDEGPVQPVEGVPVEVAAATRPWSAEEHPFPHCFVCGPLAADGLHVHPGWTPDDQAVATTWVPDVDGAGLDGERLAWAALDCPSGIAAMKGGESALLGTITARIDRAPVSGEQLVVVGRLLGAEGRKRFAASALFDAEGVALAWAEAVWIVVDR